MVAPIPTSPEMITTSVSLKNEANSLDSSNGRLVQAAEIPIPQPLATSCPLTPVDIDGTRPSSSCPEESCVANDTGRSKVAEPERIVEWSPSQRYGKVPKRYLFDL